MSKIVIHSSHKLIAWGLHGKVCSRCTVIFDIYSGAEDLEKLKAPCKG